MINRDNWKQTKKYLAYLAEIRQLDSGTLHSVQSQLRHVLEWADATPFAKAPDLRPTFPRYVTDRLSPSSVELACGHARRFFEWLRMSSSKRTSVTEIWCKSLLPPRIGETIKQYNEFTLDDVRAIAALRPDSLRVRRDHAAVAFLFLSGMRIGAFSTLPIKSVDLDSLSVKQWPQYGVKTKLKKAATTFLLDIPDLLLVVRAWDTLVRAQLGPDSLWYAIISNDGMTLCEDRAGLARDNRFSDGLRSVCKLAGVEYRTPHALRHGFAVHALKSATNIADMEAVSKNLMHGSLEVTFRVYAKLRDDDVKARIVNLGK